jgi:hypothetical protein
VGFVDHSHAAFAEAMEQAVVENHVCRRIVSAFARAARRFDERIKLRQAGRCLGSSAPAVRQQLVQLLANSRIGAAKLIDQLGTLPQRLRNDEPIHRRHVTTPSIDVHAGLMCGDELSTPRGSKRRHCVLAAAPDRGGVSIGPRSRRALVHQRRGASVMYPIA